MRAWCVVIGVAVTALWTAYSDVAGQGICFSTASNYAAGTAPAAICTGDLDGDGDWDVAVANFSGERVAVLKNNGNGVFSAPVFYTTEINCRDIVAVDLDGDTDLDLAAVNSGTHTVSVLKNNGNGTFAAKVSYLVNSGPNAIAANDLDGDGDCDLVTTAGSATSGTISVLMNNGDGTFATRVSYATGADPYSVTTVDLDGDMDNDVVITNYSHANLSVLKNNGDGTFAPVLSPAIPVLATGIAASDLDADGDQDLAMGDRLGNTACVLRNNGDGTFATAQTYPVGSNPLSVCISDVNGDGSPDLAVGNGVSSTVSVLANHGDGTFAAAVNYGCGAYPFDVCSADFDGDGDADLATVNVNGNNVSILINCLNHRPVAICQDVFVTADANCEAVVLPAQINDGSIDFEDGTSLTLEVVPEGPFTVGEIPLILIVTDSQGAKDTCNATVTVVDSMQPEVTCPAGIVADNDPGTCGAIVIFESSGMDNCSEVNVTSSPPSGSLFPIGTSDVTCIATDAAGCSDTCAFSVTVRDTEHPVITCPDDTTVEAPFGENGTYVAFSVAATDNCAVARMVTTPSSGAYFEEGPTPVTCIAEDSNGNADTCTFTVTVQVCRCPHQCDFDENLYLDALDMNALIDALFFNGPDPRDPDCPDSRSDFDCSGFPDAVDLNLLIEHIFFNGSPPTNPCVL